VDTARDIARGDPWQESLERSRARRRRARRPEQVREPQPAASQPRPGRRRSNGQTWRILWTTLQVWTERTLAARSHFPAPGPKSVAGIALLAAVVASSLAKGGPQDSTPTARADGARAAFVSQRSHSATPASGAAVSAAGSCPLAVAPAGYANPLVGATVKPERVDQGVDYAGAGTLVAIGPAKVTYVGTSNTGWPGAFIEFRLLAGADAGCYVYYAEGVVPVNGLSVGQQIAAGQPVATIIPKYPTGIELGWGSGRATKAYAKVAGQWSPADDHDNVATPAGRSFSDLIAALGGPPGKVEG
jgi:murein DD-endopeptidase MepM/ murein hydrolase activator NlpD